MSGISAASYPHLDIKNLDMSDVVYIFREDYLKPIGADRFRDGVAYQLLCLAVMSGPGAAKKLLQKAIGVTPDGHIGPKSLAALKARDETDVIMLVLAETIDYQTSLKNWKDHGKGWSRRTAKNLRYGASDS